MNTIALLRKTATVVVGIGMLVAVVFALGATSLSHQPGPYIAQQMRPIAELPIKPLAEPSQCFLCIYQDEGCEEKTGTNEQQCNKVKGYCAWDPKDRLCEGSFHRQCRQFAEIQKKRGASILIVSDKQMKSGDPKIAEWMKKEECNRKGNMVMWATHGPLCLDYVMQVKVCWDKLGSCPSLAAIHTGCSTFNNMEEALAYAQMFRDGLPKDVLVSISANQADATIGISTGAPKCQTQVKLTLQCGKPVLIKYPLCSGLVTCPTESQNASCENDSGQIVQRRCCPAFEDYFAVPQLQWTDTTRCTYAGSCRVQAISSHWCSEAAEAATRQVEVCLTNARRECEKRGKVHVQDVCSWDTNNAIFGSCMKIVTCNWSCIDHLPYDGQT